MDAGFSALKKSVCAVDAFPGVPLRKDAFMEHDFDTLELFYLRRLIVNRLDSLRRSLEKNRRFFRDTEDDVLWQQKVSNLEVETICLENAKSRINMQIAFLEFRPDSSESG